MADKIFEKYYSLIECYSEAFRDKLDNIKEDDEDDEDESPDIAFFIYDSPIDIRVLMKYLDNIIEQMYKNLGTKENVVEAVEKIKNRTIEDKKQFKWKDIYLEDLFTADYYYLKNNFILRYDLVPDEKSFTNKYSRDECDFIWPFSLKELFYFFLQKGIEIFIDNYSYLQKK